MTLNDNKVVPPAFPKGPVPVIPPLNAVPATTQEPKTANANAVATTSKEVEEPGTSGSNHRPSVLETHGYTIGRVIGAGSYASVRVAHSERYKCDVAIKIISKFQAPCDYLRKFLPREIEVVKGLRHKNLIRFLQAIETTHRVYIVMQYAENGSLLNIIRHDLHIDEDRSRRWFSQLVDAIEYCHERGIVHRDIKCENLLMDTEYNIKLSDFGFAKGNMHPKNGVAPLSDTFCGSYAYASPEILSGIPYQPQLSDVWSMGVVLYAMVFGRLPFSDHNYKHLLKQVQGKVCFPRKPLVSSSCKSLISNILAPVRSRFYISAIRNDPWMNAPANKSLLSLTSTVDTMASSGQATEVLDSKVGVDILTKEGLETQANNHRPQNIPTANEQVLESLQGHMTNTPLDL